MIYIVLILSIILFDKLSNGTKNNCLIILSSISFIALISLRCLATGQDTYQYQSIYEHLSDYKSFKSYLNDSNYIEYGYAFWQWILHYIINYRGFLFLQALIMVLPFSYVVYKRSYDPIVSMLLYILLSYLTWDMCAARQAPAVSFAFLAFFLYKEKRIKPAILVYLLAISFHVTALIILPFILIMKFLKNDIFLIISIVIANILGTIFLPKILPYMRIDYSDAILGQSVGKITYYGFLCIFALFLLLKKKYKLKLDDSFYMFSVMLILWPIVDTISAAFRITYYFLIYLTLSLPSFIYNLKKARARERHLCKYIILFICCVYFYNQTFVNNSMHVYPYYSVFDYGDNINVPMLYE